MVAVMEAGMPTAIEIPEPEIREELSSPTLVIRSHQPEMARTVSSARAIFSDSLLESGAQERAGRGLATTFSFIFECVLLGFLLLLPLMFTEALPNQQLLTFLV